MTPIYFVKRVRVILHRGEFPLDSTILVLVLLVLSWSDAGPSSDLLYTLNVCLLFCAQWRCDLNKRTVRSTLAPIVRIVYKIVRKMRLFNSQRRLRTKLYASS